MFERLIVCTGTNRMRCLLESIDGSLRLMVPPVSLCRDNAAMVGWTGIEKLRRGKTAGLETDVRAKWCIESAEDE